MNIGVITYKKYDENVLLNAHFNIDELFKIILNDKDFVKFEIFDSHKKLLVSTQFNDIQGEGLFIRPVKVEREEEIKWIDYYAYRTPSTVRHKKIRWNVSGARFKTRKKAIEYATNVNYQIAKEIAVFIDRSTSN